LYGCKTSIGISDGRTWTVFENRVLREMSGLKRKGNKMSMENAALSGA
jgi:hypothetical protein